MIMNELLSQNQIDKIDAISEWSRVEGLDALFIRAQVKELRLMEKKRLFADFESKIRQSGQAIKSLIAFF